LCTIVSTSGALDQWCTSGTQNSEPVLGRTIPPELDRNLSHEHHKCSAGAVCTQRGTYHDAYGPLSAHRRCNRAHLSRPVVHLRNSEPVLGRTISPELSRILGHEHHKCGAGAVCKQRGTYHDAYGPLSAHRRCNRAHLSRPVVHLRTSDLVLERAISPELSIILRRNPLLSIQFMSSFLIFLVSLNSVGA